MRFTVTYQIVADSDKQAFDRALGIALEQTVEIPQDIVPPGYIADEIVGQVEDLSRQSDGTFNARISYSPDSVGNELPQLLNVVMGNSCIHKGIKTIGFELGDELTRRFAGPKFGQEGVRKLTNHPEGGLIAAVLKPQGSSADTLAAIAYRCALAGANIIKDDHGLTNQKMAPFKERCGKVAAAVARANRETGGSTLYFPNIAGASDELMGFARFAKDAGAGGYLVLPGLFGFDLINQLRKSPELAMPIMSHPSLLGPFVLSEESGFSHAMMFGTIQRLAGADISVFPNFGGRFGFTEKECGSIAGACVDRHGPGLPIFPSPGGGMSIATAPAMKAMYGDDVVYLLGGSLLRYGERIGDGIRDMRRALSA